MGLCRRSRASLKRPTHKSQSKARTRGFYSSSPFALCSHAIPPKIVKLLLEQNGESIHATIGEGLYEGFTPVHCAVMNPNVPEVFECLKLLLTYGAKMKAKTKRGKRPSDLTNVRVIQEFLADPNPAYELKQNYPRKF